MSLREQGDCVPYRFDKILHMLFAASTLFIVCVKSDQTFD